MTPASPGAETDQPYLHVHGLSKIYASGHGPVRALDQVSLSGRRGEFISIVGPSGCGKSTLLMIAAGLMAPSSGVVIVDGETVLAPRTEIFLTLQASSVTNSSPRAAAGRSRRYRPGRGAG